MGALAGNKMAVFISTSQITSVGDGTKIANLSNFSLKKSAESIDISSFGDDFKKLIGGLKSGECTLSGTLDIDDAGQQIIDVGEVVYLAWFNDGITHDGYSAPFYVSDLEISAEVAGKQEFTATLNLNETPTEIGII